MKLFHLYREKSSLDSFVLFSSDILIEDLKGNICDYHIDIELFHDPDGLLVDFYKAAMHRDYYIPFVTIYDYVKENGIDINMHL